MWDYEDYLMISEGVNKTSVCKSLNGKNLLIGMQKAGSLPKL